MYFLWLLLFYATLKLTHILHFILVEPLEPSFDVPLVNITANAGETAILPCSVQHLGKHWVRTNYFA